VHVFEVLGSDVQRRITDLLADGEVSAGGLGDVVQHEFGLTQPAVSRHFAVLRESGLVVVRADGTRRRYRADPRPLAQALEWLERHPAAWSAGLDALETELARPQRAAGDTGGAETVAPVSPRRPRARRAG